MKCPGQDTRYWGAESIFEVECPECSEIIEFFKDDTWRKCKKCSTVVHNPHMDFGCALHCPYAEECIGALPEELWEKRKELQKEKERAQERARDEKLEVKSK